MKHQPLGAAVLIAFLLTAASSCNTTDTTLLPPSAPAMVKKSASCTFTCTPGPVFGDDWCEGGNWWWYLRGEFDTSICATDLTVQADVITSAGNVVHFGSDNFLEKHESVCGTEWTFELQGIAPREQVGENDRGIPKFRVAVFGPHGAHPIGTIEIYSDIQLNPNDALNRPLCHTAPREDPGYPNGQHPKN
jgi:hypothetical protein